MTSWQKHPKVEGQGRVGTHYLRGVEVVGGFWRFGRVLFCNTGYGAFTYGRSTANKIFWRTYWLTPNTYNDEGRGV